jgi:hypothetical protein
MIAALTMSLKTELLKPDAMDAVESMIDHFLEPRVRQDLDAAERQCVAQSDADDTAEITAGITRFRMDAFLL